MNFADQSCGVGIKDGRIPDSAITASSSYDENHMPFHGRLDSKKIWHPARKMSLAVIGAESLMMEVIRPT